jgi:spore coat protein CotH
LVKQFDTDGDGRLNSVERQAAREFLKRNVGGRGRGPISTPGGFGFGRGDLKPSQPGRKVNTDEVEFFPDASLYESTVLRTIFLESENPDWEEELEDFYNTDVEVPATLTVDGKKYSNVGVRFRGMSSYFAVPAGQKRSLNLSLDFVDKSQRLYGYKTLNLLNAHGDPSFLSTVLFSHIARQHIPCPKANLVRVVINGESWGVYVNAQQFNKEFVAENFNTNKGVRWKVPGSPNASGGLEYLGENVDDYKRRYDIKSSDKKASWEALIKLCKVLNQTPLDKLEAELSPLINIDNLLWFLALDVALINNDGYWVRASDYNLYLDENGKFHFIPHDMNESFQPVMGPGFGPPFGGQGMIMRMPRIGEVLPEILQDMLQLSEEQKKQLAVLQKDVDATLNKLLTNEQRHRLREMRDRGLNGFGPFGGFGPPVGVPVGPAGFGPPAGGPGGIGDRAGRGGVAGFGPTGRFGPPGFGGSGVELDPLVALDDPRKPLRSKVLAVPKWRTQYLRNIRTIAEESLDWKTLGPVVAQYRSLIEKEVEADTRKLSTTEAFRRATSDMPEVSGGRGLNLRAFADLRRTYLLNHPEIKKVIP